MHGFGIVNDRTHALSEAGRQVLGFDESAVADDHGAFQGVTQLAYISGPRVSLKHSQYRFAYVGDLAVVFLIHIGKQTFHQLADIFFMLAERRHMNVENVETVIKVLAQFSVGDGVVGNFVGRGEHAHVDRGFDLAAEAAEFVIFKHAQQLGLGAHGHLANLVEEQRSAFG